MKNINIILVSIFFLANTTILNSQTENKKYSNYSELRQAIGKYYGNKEYQKAIDILNEHLKVFPENIETNTLNLTYCYIALEKYEEGIDAMFYGLNNGIWFNKYALASDILAPLKKLSGFQKLIEKNEQKRMEAQNNSRPDILIVEPENFSEGKEYPLFIALHGGGGNIPDFKNLWKSDIMEREFIVAYLQSSQMVSMNGYSWDDMEIANREITDAYNKIACKYDIKENEIIVGGFSAGGRASLASINRSNIPYSGFIILSPPKPDDFSDAYVKKMAKNNIRSSIITNPKDPCYEDQRFMANSFKVNGMQYQFVDTPPIGHWFPDKLNELIDQSILYIRNR